MKEARFRLIKDDGIVGYMCVSDTIVKVRRKNNPAWFPYGEVGNNIYYETYDLGVKIDDLQLYEGDRVNTKWGKTGVVLFENGAFLLIWEKPGEDYGDGSDEWKQVLLDNWIPGLKLIGNIHMGGDNES